VVFFRTSNQLLNLANGPHGSVQPASSTGATAAQRLKSTDSERTSSDTHTLIRLLSESEFSIETSLGYSKGYLGIAHALQSLAFAQDSVHFERARDIGVTTTGAVVAFPPGLRPVRQYLGV